MIKKAEKKGRRRERLARIIILRKVDSRTVKRGCLMIVRASERIARYSRMCMYVSRGRGARASIRGVCVFKALEVLIRSRANNLDGFEGSRQ